MKDTLSKKDQEKRKFMLEGDMWKVVMYISMPLAIYNGFNHLFSLLDTMMAAHIGSEVVSAVAYISQIKTMISALGGGLAVGGGIIIARYYGAGDVKNTRKYMNTLLFMSILISLGVLGITVPFARPILRFVRTPEELINVGLGYFIIEIGTLVAIFINNVYMAIERAKGNSKKILNLNLMVLGLKLFLTFVFIYMLGYGVTMMAFATLIAQMALTIAGLLDMFRRGNIFRPSIKEIDFSMKTIRPIFILAAPIFFEKFAFSFGKVIVNSMSVLYGSMVVGALGVSNNIAGLVTSLGNGYQDGEASIISQNLGNENFERAIDAFKKTLIISIVIGCVGFVLTTLFMEPIISVFARGNMEFANEIRKIFGYERYAIIAFTTASAVMGLLYGFGYTRLSLVVNFMRLFLFRIPVLYILQNFTNFGSESVGIAMMISNGLIGLTSVFLCFYVIQKMKRTGVSYKIAYAD